MPGTGRQRKFEIWWPYIKSRAAHSFFWFRSTCSNHLNHFRFSGWRGLKPPGRGGERPRSMRRGYVVSDLLLFLVASRTWHVWHGVHHGMVKSVSESKKKKVIWFIEAKWMPQGPRGNKERKGN